MMPNYYIMITEVKRKTERKFLRKEQVINQTSYLQGVYDTFEEANEAYKNLPNPYYNGVEHAWVQHYDPSGGYYKTTGSDRDDRYMMAVLYCYKKIERDS